MKKLGLLIICMLACASLLVASMAFDPEIFHAKTAVVCFDANVLADNQGNMKFELNDGVVKTGLTSFDALAREFKIIDIQPFFSFVKDKNCDMEGVFIQNIYNLYFESNDGLDEALAALNNDKNLLYAEFETINRLKYVPNDLDYGQQWYLEKIGCPEVWDYVQGSSEVVVGITDSGVFWNHEDLYDNIWINQAELVGMTINVASGSVSGGDGIDNDGNGKVDDVIGWDFYATSGGGMDNNPMQNFPGNEHGTHVAGIVSAVGDNWTGIAGVAMNVKILACKGVPIDQETTGVSRGYEQIRYCADTGADIINCSWGGPGDGNTASAAVTYAFMQGSLVVAAAGNDNVEHNNNYQDFPADCVDAICVAATNSADGKAGFSDYGEPIDISAPGMSIFSTYYGLDGSYFATQGTSMSSPVVAGVCALLKSYQPTFDASDIRQRVLESAKYIYDINPSYVGDLGSGRVDAFKALFGDEFPYIVLDEHEFAETDGDVDGVPNPGDTFEFKFSFINELGWAPAENMQVVMRTEAAGVTIIDSLIEYDTILSGSAAWNPADDTFIVSTDSDMQDLIFDLELHVTAGVGYTYEKKFTHTVELSLRQIDWPLNIGSASSSAPIFIDLDNDGNLELVFGNTDGKIHAMNIDGTTELAGFPVQLSDNIKGALSIGQLDSDEYLEIVAATADGHIYGIDDDGTQIFDYAGVGSFLTNPVIADVNGDSVNEIVAVSSTSKVYLLDAAGNDYANFPMTASGRVQCSPLVADLNGDGHKEIIFSTFTHNLFAVSSNTGLALAGFPANIGGIVYKGIALAFLDADAAPEIIVGNGTSQLRAIDNDGTELWNISLGSPVKSAVVVADIDNDSTPDNADEEIIVTCSGGHLYVIETDGTIVDGFPVELEYSVQSTPIIADITGDDLPEMIFGDIAGEIHAYDVFGRQASNFPLKTYDSFMNAAAIADFDGDNDYEIAIAGSGYMHVLDYKVECTARSPLIPCYGGNAARNRMPGMITAINDNLGELARASQLIGNYPNPFNPRTLIQFNTQKAGHAKLEIFNVRGQRVVTLLNERVAVGAQTRVWEGVDDNKNPVASGVYMYKLTTDDSTQMKKMLLLK